MLEFFFVKGRPRMLELWREFDLMPPQQMMLGLLDEPRPMGELAQVMHCDNSNITGIVDRLSERGLVERQAAEGDRRVKLIALTDEGRALRDELVRRRSVPPAEIEELSEADLKRLHRIFTAALD
jgi:DNA-binding MarR family transcriptional regulator